jgi:hypothetical protein
MRRPRLFWAAFTGAGVSSFAVIDLWANFNDVEGDTWSEGFRSIGLPDWLLATGLAAGAAGLFVHLKRRTTT